MAQVAAAAYERSGMKFRLPVSLQKSEDNDALAYLRAYYAKKHSACLGYVNSGARFDDWDSTGTRAADVDRFTADDLVAVTFLSVQVPPEAACGLLAGRPGYFSELLPEMPDRDLVTVDPSEINEEWPPWRAWNRLRELSGVDWVIASKLLARKRPRLVPVYDRIVREVTGSDPVFWTPLCEALRENNGELHHRLLGLRDEAGLPTTIPALRVFDVIAWMEGRWPHA
jgi:hypothetical protein